MTKLFITLYQLGKRLSRQRKPFFVRILAANMKGWYNQDAVILQEGRRFCILTYSICEISVKGTEDEYF